MVSQPHGDVDKVDKEVLAAARDLVGSHFPAATSAILVSDSS
jgi:hypothetical protein